MGSRRPKSRTHSPVCTRLGPNRPPPPARVRCEGGSPCTRHCARRATSSPWAAAVAAAARI
eukprot:scaffold135841_cov105-Phaeocystis_antarctica.AAC.1